MRSPQAHRLRSLVFGYIEQEFTFGCPVVLIKLIQLFCNELIHWRIDGRQIDSFLAAKNGDSLLCAQSFTFRDIEFGYKMYPNGKSQSDIGMVSPFLRLKLFPSDVEYVGVYYRFHCLQTHCVHDRFKRFYKKKASGIYLMHLSKCADIESLDFDCFVDIKYIKYKSQDISTNPEDSPADSSSSDAGDAALVPARKQDYIKPSVMQKHVRYQWHVEGELMAQCVQLKTNEYIVSQGFDGNNWNLRWYFLESTSSDKITIDLNCIALPYGIKYFQAHWTVSLHGDGTHKESKRTVSKFQEPHFNATHQFDIPKTKHTQVTVSINLEITDLWDDQECIVDRSQWRKYGVIHNLGAMMA